MPREEGNENSSDCIGPWLRRTWQTLVFFPGWPRGQTGAWLDSGLELPVRCFMRLNRSLKSLQADRGADFPGLGAPESRACGDGADDLTPGLIGRGK